MSEKTDANQQDVLVFLESVEQLVVKALGYLKSECQIDGRVDNTLLDRHQLACFDLAVCTAEISAARSMLSYANKVTDPDGIENELAVMFSAEVLANTRTRLQVRGREMGLSRLEIDQLSHAEDLTHFIEQQLSAENMAAIGTTVSAMAGETGTRLLDDEKELIRSTFRQFSDDIVKPAAEMIHRQDLIIPDEIIDGLKQLGCFGLSVPMKYGGLLPDDREDNLGMIVVTEELSRGSLGGAGSLITRPEIMARALMEGGTEEQRLHWLPKLAKGEPLCGVAITEPDYGSDVASMKLKATITEGGWLLNGTKTWSTFAGKAGVLLTLARTDPDTSLGHRGLSLFLVEKPDSEDNAFKHTQDQGGSLSGKAIATIGYRGMHSFELFFDNYFVASENLVGEGQGVGRGFYFTMKGFTGGRIQTAARACGVMQAAYEAAVRYASDRKVFGQPISDYQLTRVKLARMAAYLSASRQFTYAVGKMMDEGSGQIEASLVKLFACKASEWITREAMQIHGGMGYAEESEVSRYFLDARVLSIFEGTEETLALKVVGRSLVENAVPGRQQPLK
jgi:(2S)-methylsuccinyl-CoA dehydrogenase